MDEFDIVLNELFIDDFSCKTLDFRVFTKVKEEIIGQGKVANTEKDII